MGSRTRVCLESWGEGSWADGAVQHVGAQDPARTGSGAEGPEKSGRWGGRKSLQGGAGSEGQESGGQEK